MPEGAVVMPQTGLRRRRRHYQPHDPLGEQPNPRRPAGAGQRSALLAVVGRHVAA